MTNLSTFLVLLLVLPPSTRALNFTFSSFNINQAKDLIFEGNATISGAAIDITNITIGFSNYTFSAGRVLYREPMQLWDVQGSKKRLADFTTHFTFIITGVDFILPPPPAPGHGFTFFLVPEHAKWFPDARGRLLGLFESDVSALNETNNQVVAVEIDTASGGGWDPSDQHIGIDVNSIKSKSFELVTGGFLNRTTAHVWVTYNSMTRNLSAHLTFEGSSDSFTVWYVIDLSDVLPSRVQVGFTGTTTSDSESYENQKLFSWSFASYYRNETIGPEISPSPSPKTSLNPNLNPKTSTKMGAFVGVGLAGLFVIVLISAVLVYYYKSRSKSQADQILFDDLGTTKFSYSQLSRATNNFAKERKLGSGGFGDVYEGLLVNPKIKVAVKKFRGGSNQGEKEYVSEVKIISKLKHRNIVSLIGWSHDRGELLLVYEFMPNRSLDFHLYGTEALPLLPWPTRYSIACGLASAVHYLHKEGDQCVVHRDIKSSNVMLDSDFNARLGDFGVARFTDHGQSLNTTIPAGTLAYLAPECLKNGKAGKESDVYSFGIVALEIACGRKPIELLEEDQGKVNLVEWVVNLHARGLILEAIDKRLDVEFDEDQARGLMVVGLWCCHPDPSQRPSMKQVIAALEAPLSSLLQVSTMPVNYVSSEMNDFPSYGSYNISSTASSSS